jgi:hypothetical protein
VYAISRIDSDRSWFHPIAMSESGPGTISYAIPTTLRGDRLVVRGDATVPLTLVIGGTVVLVGSVVVASLAVGACLLVLVALLMFVFGIGRLVDRPAELIIDDAALLSTRGARVEVAWSAVEDVRVVRSFGVRFLALRLQPAAVREVAAVSYQRPGGVRDDEVLIPVGGLELSVDRILLEVSTRVMRARARPVVEIEEEDSADS